MNERDIIEIKKLLNLILKGSQDLITLDKVTELLGDYYSKEELESLAETWTFTLDDNTQVTKKVLCLTLQP